MFKKLIFPTLLVLFFTLPFDAQAKKPRRPAAAGDLSKLSDEQATEMAIAKVKESTKSEDAALSGNDKPKYYLNTMGSKPLSREGDLISLTIMRTSPAAGACAYDVLIEKSLKVVVREPFCAE